MEIDEKLSYSLWVSLSEPLPTDDEFDMIHVAYNSTLHREPVNPLFHDVYRIISL